MVPDPARRDIARAIAPPLGRLGSLEVRLATSAGDIDAAQRLRFAVFHEERRRPPLGLQSCGRDVDVFDRNCDHLVVIDRAVGRCVVGTYRLLRQERAAQQGFYSAAEFEVEELVGGKPGLRFLELGRAAVLKPYRNKRTVELLWHGIWAYVLHHRIDAMFGCACFDGTDPQQLALPLSYLHHYARAPEGWRTRALPGRSVAMNMLPREAVDTKRALQSLPPLIKGYLRVGATFADGAVVDPDFGTTDVLVVLPVAQISPRYISHFGPDAERHAA